MSHHGPRPKIPTCGHPTAKHIARGMCSKCYEHHRNQTLKRRRQMEGWKRTYTKDQRRKWHLKSVYSLSSQRSEAIFSAQNNSCAICRTPLPARHAVDHDHNCCSTHKSCGNCVRGFLCIRCNTLVGIRENNPTLFNSVEEYLNNPPAFNIQEEYVTTA